MWRGAALCGAIAVATLSGCSSGGRKPSPPPAKVCIVAWSPIGEDENGSALSSPTTYRLEYGPAPNGPFSGRVNLPAGASRYVLRAAKGRTWNVRLIALNSERGESEPSNVGTCAL